ncbi:NRDE family protein [Noviherbaspirillum galbum]|uniref:NRDE family protein n=1 Tax=Noviherbaspirillum galbum TaxID=2709383 RepID=A0A6B3SPQ5_9BURK|nr:NRDE family protein [Noviherbaspirillum galbum]NEX59709.1 NRDE family protein [Noviherbaspirillum galbum]
MCLIVFAWQVVPGMPLLAAGNRDEFFERPTEPAHWWEDHPDIYAGRDRRDGGTWMGINRDGRFACITNVRAPNEKRSDAPSRGKLVRDYLAGSLSPEDYIREIAAGAHRYNGFNLLIGHHRSLVWFSNKAEDDPRNGKPLAPGVYGLSNASLDSPWPKVVRTKAQFASLLCQGAPREAYIEMLSDTTRASDCRLPHTGVSKEWERVLSAAFIESPEYGTRSSTVVQLAGERDAALYEHVVR